MRGSPIFIAYTQKFHILHVAFGEIHLSSICLRSIETPNYYHLVPQYLNRRSKQTELGEERENEFMQIKRRSICRVLHRHIEDVTQKGGQNSQRTPFLLGGDWLGRRQATLKFSGHCVS